MMRESRLVSPRLSYGSKGRQPALSFNAIVAPRAVARRIHWNDFEVRSRIPSPPSMGAGLRRLVSSAIGSPNVRAANAGVPRLVAELYVSGNCYEVTA
jgi:hypothetical protein